MDNDTISRPSALTLPDNLASMYRENEENLAKMDRRAEFTQKWHVHPKELALFGKAYARFGGLVAAGYIGAGLANGDVNLPVLGGVLLGMFVLFAVLWKLLGGSGVRKSMEMTDRSELFDYRWERRMWWLDVADHVQKTTGESVNLGMEDRAKFVYDGKERVFRPQGASGGRVLLISYTD